jgi:uncharacterized protein
MARRKPLPNRAERRRAERRRKRTLIAIVALIALPVVAGLIYMSLPKSQDVNTGPKFTKQGELQLLDGETGEQIQQIDIEIKQNDQERAEGMMWRRSMEEDQGMLFIMDRNEPQSFWMRNTYIPLDIMFIGVDKRIVNIRKNAQPQSLSPQPSQGNAKYVLEVVGGFADKYGVEAGDRMAFTRE